MMSLTEEEEKNRALTNPYVMNKFQLGPEYAPEARQEIINQNEADAAGPNWAASIAALGAGLQGRDAMSAGQSILNMQKAKREGKLSEFDKKRALALEDMQMKQFGDLMARENDPNSQESIIARDTAISMGMDPKIAGTLTAAQFKKFSPVLEKKYQIAENARKSQEERDFKAEQSRLAREQNAILAGERKAAKEEAVAAKNEEKMQRLQTPYGLANTEDDAKQLKAAHELKKSFDNKLNQMIALRQKHGGGTNSYINPTDVDAAMSLSKDLLLEYKNLQKLGVLSQSDESIINAIIPKDPLEYNSIAATVKGEDPLLNRMKMFRKNSNEDFSTRVATRTRKGLEDYAQGKDASTPKLSGASGSWDTPDSETVAIITPKGQLKEVPKKDLQMYLDAGAKEKDQPQQAVVGN